MKPVCYAIERVGNTWVAFAKRRGVLSFDNEQIAIATIKDATVLLIASKRGGRKRVILRRSPLRENE
jgi:hypothetical protein